MPPVMADESPSPDNMEQQVNPDFIQQAASFNDQGIFDATAIASLAKNKNLQKLLMTYMPPVEAAMDNMGRILLLFYMQEPELMKQIGSEAYNETEQKIRDVFQGLGDAVLAINQNATQVRGSNSQ